MLSSRAASSLTMMMKIGMIMMRRRRKSLIVKKMDWTYLDASARGEKKGSTWGEDIIDNSNARNCSKIINR